MITVEEAIRYDTEEKFQKYQKFPEHSSFDLLEKDLFLDVKANTCAMSHAKARPLQHDS